MSFELLPTELVQHILRGVDLDDPISREGLRHLARCSKRFHQLTIPFLFSKLIQSRGHAVPLFLRSTLTNKSVSQYTRTLKTSAALASFAFTLPSIFSSSEKNTISAIIQTASDGDSALAKKWMDDIFSDVNNYDAVIAVLLCSLPNLERLHIDSYGRVEGYPYIQHVLERAARLQEEQMGHENGRHLFYSMSNLVEVRLSFHKIDHEFNFCDVFCFAGLRSVHTFACDKFAAAHGHFEQRFSSHVRDLTFNQAAICPLNLTYILKHCNLLRRFKFERWDPTADYDPFSPPGIIWGLESSRNSLEEVVLYVVPERLMRKCTPADWSGFLKLEQLDLSWFALMGKWDLVMPDMGTEERQGVFQESLRRMPRSLRVLRISSCDARVLPFIWEIMPTKYDHTPVLQKVILAPPSEIDLFATAKETYFTGKEHLTEFCSGFQVQLVII